MSGCPNPGRQFGKIDLARLREEFARKVKRKHAALQDIRELIEKKLARMIAANPTRMDYYKKYQQIIAGYNREKDPPPSSRPSPNWSSWPRASTPNSAAPPKRA